MGHHLPTHRKAMRTPYPEYPPGTMVVLDEKHKVKVVSQSPHKMITEVMDIDTGSKWSVMTSRLKEIKPKNAEKP